MGEAKSTEAAKAAATRKSTAARSAGLGSSVGVNPVLAWQDQVGNAALARLLGAGVIRPKLAISEPGEPQEREADRIADQLVSPALLGGSIEDSDRQTIHRQTDASSGGAIRAGHDAQSIVSGLDSGHALDQSVRAAFEPRLGRNLGDVRVHTSATAADTAHALHAHAFTLGRDVVFGANQYAPATTEGRRLIAHELTHVVQQGAAPTIGGLPGGSADAAFQYPTLQRSWVPGALRSDEGTKEQIADAIKNDDPGDVKAINDFSKAAASDKLKLARILLAQTWLGPFDKRALTRIFNSFGDLEKLDADTVAVIKHAYEHGYSLHDLSRYDNLIFDFKDEVKHKALDNLSANIELVITEADRLGVSGDKPPTQAQDAAMREQQELAGEIRDAKSLMADCRKIIVAHHGFLATDPLQIGKPILFDPQQQPVEFGVSAVMAPSPGTHEMPWETIYSQYSAIARAIASILNQNPALYALTSLTENAPTDQPKGSEDPRLNFGQQRIEGFNLVSAEAARKKVRDALTQVWNNARESLGKVMSGDLSPLQFDSLIARFQGGDFGVRWATPYAKLSTRAAVSEAESSFDRTMAEIGLALLLVSVAIGSAGPAAPVLGAILAGVNVGTAGVAAAIATLNAQEMKKASQSTVSDSGAIVSPEKAGKAELDAIMYQFAAIAAVGAEAVGALLTVPGGTGAIELGGVSKLPVNEQASAIAAALETMEPGQVALRTGIPPDEMLAIVAPRATANPSAEAAASKLREFLNRFRPLIGPTAHEESSLAFILRKAKMTFREYWTRLYGLGPRDVDSVTLHAGFGDAELTYIQLIENTPAREAGIYQNLTTGEHAVVQGIGGNRAMVQHMNNLPEAAGQRWILIEHYHPESNWAVQFPSGGIGPNGPTGDFAVLLQDYGETNIAGVMQGQPSNVIRQRITARIRYRDPVSGRYHYTTYGYDPSRGHLGAFFAEVETETGSVVDYSFKDIGGIGGARADYERHMRGIARGQPVVKATP